MKKEDIHDELAGLSPLLRQLKEQNNGMSVPPDYFARLNERVVQRLEAEGENMHPEPAPFRGVFVNRTRITAIAAAVTLLLAAWWWLRPAPQPQIATLIPETIVNDTLTQEDAELYIRENILEFDTELLAAEFESEEAPEEKTPANNTSVNAELPHHEEVEDLLDDLTEEELNDLL